MDPNIPNVPAGAGLPTNPNPPQSPPSISQPQPEPVVSQATDGGSSSKKWIFIVLGVIGLVAIVGGVYFFLSSQQPQQTQQAVQIDTSELDSLGTETQQINLGEVESDFYEVDSDLQGL